MGRRVPSAFGARRRTARWAASCSPSTTREERADVGRDGGVLGEGRQHVRTDGDEGAEEDEPELGVAADRSQHQLAHAVVVVPAVVEVVESGRVVVVVVGPSSSSSMSRSMLAT